MSDFRTDAEKEAGVPLCGFFDPSDDDYCDLTPEQEAYLEEQAKKEFDEREIRVKALRERAHIFSLTDDDFINDIEALIVKYESKGLF